LALTEVLEVSTRNIGYMTRDLEFQYMHIESFGRQVEAMIEDFTRQAYRSSKIQSGSIT